MLYDNLVIDIVGFVLGVVIVVAVKKSWAKTLGWVLVGWCGVGIAFHFLG